MWEATAGPLCKELRHAFSLHHNHRTQPEPGVVSSAEPFNRMEEPNPEQPKKVGVHYQVIRFET